MLEDDTTINIPSLIFTMFQLPSITVMRKVQIWMQKFTNVRKKRM